MAEIDRDIAVQRGWRFGPFTLDLERRELARDGEPVALSARYFDALVLLLEADGAVVAKDTFMDRAWHGVPVTDEALTQGIRALRKALGDDAGSPTYVATVPKHGYRFVGNATPFAERDVASSSPVRSGWHPASSGALGGALAGIPIGVFYGSFASAGADANALSALLVLVMIAVVAGGIAGLGLGLGTAIGERYAPNALWPRAVGAIVGGAITGALGRMLALDGFGLVFGSGPGAMTGALEGAAMGLAIGFGIVLVSKTGPSWKRAAVAGGIAGAGLAALLPLAGGRMLGGSLAEVGAQFGASRLRIDSLGTLVGETGFGPWTLAATGALEAFLFCAIVVVALTRFPAR